MGNQQRVAVGEHCSFPRTDKNLLVIRAEKEGSWVAVMSWQMHCLSWYICWGSFWNWSSVLSATQSLTYSNLILLLCKYTSPSFNIPLFLQIFGRVKESAVKYYFLLMMPMSILRKRHTHWAFLSHITLSVWKPLLFPDGLVREI